jgi:hypothetical protein
MGQLFRDLTLTFPEYHKQITEKYGSEGFTLMMEQLWGFKDKTTQP